MVSKLLGRRLPCQRRRFRARLGRSAQVQLSTQRADGQCHNGAHDVRARHQHDRRSDARCVCAQRGPRLRQDSDRRASCARCATAFFRAGMPGLMRIGERSAAAKSAKLLDARASSYGEHVSRRQFERGWTLAPDEDGRLIRSVGKAENQGTHRQTRFVDSARPISPACPSRECRNR